MSSLNVSSTPQARASPFKQYEAVAQHQNNGFDKAPPLVASSIATHGISSAGGLVNNKVKQTDQNCMSNATTPLAQNHQQKIELPELNAQKMMSSQQNNNNDLKHMPIFRGPASNTISPRDITTLQMLNNMPTTMDSTSGLISPNLASVVARKAQQHYDFSTAGYYPKKNSSIATAGMNSVTNEFVKSHRMPSKIRGHLMAQQTVPSMQGASHQVLGPLTKLKSHNNTKTSLKPEGNRRRNQSPMLTVTDSLQEQRDALMKPSKTRNNLRQHVISHQINPRNGPKQAVVGQPYISFKNEKQSSQLGGAKQGNIKQKNLDALEKRELIVNQQLAEGYTGGGGKSRYINMQKAKSNRPSLKHPSGTSIDSDLSHQQLHKQHSRQYLFMDQLKDKRKSSFSYSSNMERDWQTQRRPSVWNGHNPGQLLNSDQRMAEESSSTNCVINVFGPTHIQHPSSVQTTMTNMDTTRTKRKYISRQAPAVVSQGGRPSPRKFPVMSTSKATENLKNNKSTEAIEYVDQPIAISDQEEIKLPQSLINSGQKKRSLAGTSVYDSIDNGELLNYQPQVQQNVLRFSPKKNSEGTPQIQILGQTEVTNNDSAVRQGIRSQLNKEEDNQTQHKSPRVEPSPQWNESRSQVEIPNLSTYQSQAVASRLRTEGTKGSSSKQPKPLMEQSGVLDTANNVLSEKTMDEDSYTDEDDYGVTSHKQKSALDLRAAEKQAQDQKNAFMTSQRHSKGDKASVFVKNVTTGNQQLQQSQKRFVGRDSQKAIPVLNTRYQNQTESKQSPINQRDQSLSSNQKSNTTSKNNFKSFRRSVQHQKELLQQAYLADFEPAQQQQQEKTRKHSQHIVQLLQQQKQQPQLSQYIASNIVGSQKKKMKKTSNTNSTDSLGVKSRFQNKKHSMQQHDIPISAMKTNTAEDTTDSIMLIKQQVSLTHTSDKPYTEAKMLINSAAGNNSVAIDAPDVLGVEFTADSQDGSVLRLKTPNQVKVRARKQLNGVVPASGKSKKQNQSNVVYDALPYVKPTRNPQKIFQTMDRKQIKTKSALSPMPVPHGAVKFHKVSTKEKDGLAMSLSQADFKDVRAKGDPNTSFGRNSKNSLVGTNRRKNLALNAASATAGSKKQQSVSPSLREKDERSGKRGKHMFATNDYCMNTSIGLSSSVTSLPRIITEERQGNVPLRTQQRNLVTQIPHSKFATSKSSIGENSVASHENNNKQYLSSRLHAGAPYEKSKIDQSILSPLGRNKHLSQVKITKALKKSTKSSSVLKVKGKEPDSSRFPKLKKQVSIKEHRIDEAPSTIASNQDSGLLESHVPRSKRRQGTPLRIIESNADMKEVVTGNRKVQIPDLHLKAATKHGKSNSQAANSSLFASKNQMVSNNVAEGGSTERAKQPYNAVAEPLSDQQPDSGDYHSLSNIGMRKQSQQVKTMVGRSITTEDSAGLLSQAEHQIRIEISKTEVLDSMKKEHKKDLSLLFYDFNNSKARLMSKMKKMSDFVIQEENAEADGDGAVAPQNEDTTLRKKQPVVFIKDKLSLSPSSKKHQSTIGSDKTKSTLKKVKHHAIESNKKSEGIIDHFPLQASASKGSQKFTCQPAFEASNTKLDLPVSTQKNASKLSTTDVTQIQTEMDFVNKKIDKAKQSISQLQNEGGIKGINLQSPARLTNSRNSSTHTLKQHAQQLVGTPDLPPVQDYGLTSVSSPNMIKGKKIFLFNQSTAAKENFDARNRSPCFGSVKNSQHILPNSTERHVNSIDNIASLADQYSHSLSSLRIQSNHGSVNKNTPFPQPQNGLVAFSRRSEQSLNDYIVQTSQQDVGCTGATAGELESSLSNQVTLMQNTTKQVHGGIGGTGYQTSATNEHSKQSGKKQRRNIAGSFKKRLPSMTLGSPALLNKQRQNRKSQDMSNDGAGKVMITDSDYAMQSSQHDVIMSERDSVIAADDTSNEQEGGVISVIAYVKENKQIWE